MLILEAQVQAVLEAAKIRLADGTMIYAPCGAFYRGLWPRDYEYVVEGAGDILKPDDLRAVCKLLIRHQKTNGWVPIMINPELTNFAYVNGGPKQESDAAQFFVKLVYQDFLRSKDVAFAASALDPMKRAMDSTPRDQRGLVWIDPKRWHTGYGFTDGTGKSGQELFSSLLYWECCGSIAKMARAAGKEEYAADFTARAKLIKQHIDDLKDGKTGLYFAASKTCRQLDVWGNAYLVYIGFPDDARRLRISRYLADHYDQFVYAGQVRHLFGNEYWERIVGGDCSPGIYQNGGYWGTASGWTAYAIAQVNPALASRMFGDLIDYYQTYGPYESVNDAVQHRRNKFYSASVTLPLAALRRLSEETEVTKMPLDPGKANPIVFAPTEAKFVRLTVSDSRSGDEPGLDEVEVYTKDGTNNLALASAGGKATASSCLAGYAKHKVEHLNDGLFGNDHSWIGGGSAGWVQIELAQPAPVGRVVVSRDRTGAFRDRMPTVIGVAVSGDGQTWQQVTLVKSPGAPSKMPPPSDPVTNLAEAVKWLEGEAHRIIRDSAVPMRDGTMAFPPQVGIGYDAFWLRDYEYALEGSIQSLSDKELTDACRVFIKAVREDGAAVDCVRFDGTPIYKPGYGSMGREPVLDGPPFTVSVAWQTYRRTKDKALLKEVLDPLVKTMTYMPRNPTNGLAHIKFPGERCPYGFTDSISKSGDELFCSLLMVQASRQLGDLLEAGGRTEEAQKWRKEAERISGSVRGVFWDGQSGLFRSTTGTCNVPDIWGSAFAVWLGVATKEQAQKIAKYFKEHHDELVLHGQVRHMPGFMDWNGRKTATNSGQYQSGGFWATPVGWFVYTLDLVNPALADQTVIEMVRHFQGHGACEWINREGQCQLPGYTASAALPLDGIRAMLERRASPGVVEHYVKTLRLSDLLGEYHAGPPTCPISGDEMVASEGSEYKGLPYYWRCANPTCNYWRKIDERPLEGGMIRCRKCGGEVKFGEWGRQTPLAVRWRPEAPPENRSHSPSAAEDAGLSAEAGAPQSR
jgi:hypothetical protein